jgi:hypothetical protein
MPKTELTYEDAPGNGLDGCVRSYDDANTGPNHYLCTTGGKLLPKDVKVGMSVQILPLGKPKTLVTAIALNVPLEGE